jgi:hypothetical protein
MYPPASTMFRALTGLTAIAVIALLSACGAGSGQGLDADGNLLGSAADAPVDDGGSGPIAASGNPNATLAWVQSNVFGGVCTQCHTGAGAPLGVDWSTESSSCSNIDRASGEIPSLMEIKSGDPAASYVVWKLENAGPNGEAIVGAQMPLSNPALSADSIKNIKDWIGDGTPGCASSRPAGNTAGSNVAMRSGESASFEDSGYPPGSWPYVWEQSLRLCSTCHSLTPSMPACADSIECPPAGLVLGSDNYYGLFDGKTVTPFDLDASNLWRRVSDEVAAHPEPFGYPSLTEAQRNIIRDWILDGAPLVPAPAD